MNNPVFFYLAFAASGIVLAVVWLAISDLRQGKKVQFDSSSNKQKAVLTPKAAWIGFSWRTLPTAAVLCISILNRWPVVTLLGVLSVGLNIVILAKMLRQCRVQAVVK